ncbi:DUF1659 domain-containing protein [Lysinibacillus odysseyi]|uniref:DUF1659 domain-containing protein n=1 Tax=Lysinibacillus odysseyi 34hs-1 = NBRC 100172 TaxID=1220589 RepID=A0A0A3IH92_9BACI|nr:DUF1659 domain-containing protein [Lysinibacillus odysseyi]KGR82198.1 hypothetical protein CD32_23250 [Lysinibacillus odysseyi 34hs-1 = NBRC 100172]
MPAFQFQQAALTVNFFTGVDAEGKSIFKRVTYRNVTDQATAEQLQQVAQAISGLTSYTPADVEKTEKQIIV